MNVWLALHRRTNWSKQTDNSRERCTDYCFSSVCIPFSWVPKGWTANSSEHIRQRSFSSLHLLASYQPKGILIHTNTKYDFFLLHFALLWILLAFFGIKKLLAFASCSQVKNFIKFSPENGKQRERQVSTRKWWTKNESSHLSSYPAVSVHRSGILQRRRPIQIGFTSLRIYFHGNLLLFEYFMQQIKCNAIQCGNSNANFNCDLFCFCCAHHLIGLRAGRGEHAARTEFNPLERRASRASANLARERARSPPKINRLGAWLWLCSCVRLPERSERHSIHNIR